MEAGTHIPIEDFLAEDRPHHLSTGLHVGGIGEPTGIIGEASAVEEGTAEPNENDGQMAEVCGEDPPRNLLEVTRMSVKVVSVGVEVPNPGCGFGTLGEGSVEVSGLSEQLEGRWIVDLLDLALRTVPTLWWADGHRVVPRGTGSRWWATPPAGRNPTGPRRIGPKGLTCRATTCVRGKPLSASWSFGPRKGDLSRKHRGGG